MSSEILKILKPDGIKLSLILLNKKLIDGIGGTDNLIAEIDSLLAKGFITIEHEYDEDEGDDFQIKITDSGGAFLRFKEKERESEK